MIYYYYIIIVVRKCGLSPLYRAHIYTVYYSKKLSQMIKGAEGYNIYNPFCAGKCVQISNEAPIVIY